MPGSSQDRSGADSDRTGSSWIPERDDTTTSMMWQVLKGQTEDHVRQDTEDKEGDREGAFRIRCPLCFWQPSASSRWTCQCQGTPEPPFNACGAVWNTFDTRGKCPGCGHQWLWTTCLQCRMASRHEEWYEEDGPDD